MTPSLAEARAVAREHLAWAASQGVWPGDLLVGIGVRRLYGRVLAGRGDDLGARVAASAAALCGMGSAGAFQMARRAAAGGVRRI